MWQDAFQRLVVAGKRCPICQDSSVDRADYTAYSWRCGSSYGKGKYHGTAAFVRWYKKNLEMPRVVAPSGTYDRVMKEYYKPAMIKEWAGWGWNAELWKKDEEKEKIGDTNEFGEICP